MKVVITGSSGFVGQNLSQYLQKENNIVLNLSLRADDWKLNLDKDSNAIIHLAGKAHDTSNTADEAEYFKINTELTKQVFDEFLDSEIKDFFYFSSVKAVADIVADVLYEDVESNPKTPYGASKLKAEDYLLTQKIPEGKRIFIIRPCMIHGPGNKGNLNLLYKVVEKGFPYPLAAYDNERSFLSVENLNYLVLQMIENKNISSGVYNFADDDFISTNALIVIISKAIGKKPKLLKIPKKWIQTAAKTGDFLHLPLNTERLTKLTENYRVSNQKIKKALGIAKLPISAEEGLLTTIQSFAKRK